MANKKKIKGTVSVFSNSPGQPTGYGVATEALVSRLKRDGADVSAISNYGHEGIVREYETSHGSIPLYPRGADIYSNDSGVLSHKHWKALNAEQPDLLITLYDVWVFQGKQWDDVNVASWTPIDHNPVPPAVANWSARPNVTPLAMSQFGQKQLEALGIESIYIPHSVDTKIFKPKTSIDGRSLSEYMGIDKDRFVVGMNAANKSSGLIHRKAFGENLMAFSIFCKKYPDAILYIHADPVSQYGWNLMALGQTLGIPVANMVFVDPVSYRFGISQSDLAGIYSSMDVFLGTSYGEGFGVPTVEAQACGVPVIVTDFAASSELVGDGWAVSGQPLYDNAQVAFFNIPSIPQIVEALEEAYNRGKGKSEEAIEFAKQFDHDVVWDKYWLPALHKLLK
jgi:glycosyltransferase involved in cell wall biosynthesis